MSDINLEWLQQNLKKNNPIIFNIGCADISDDSLRFQIAFPTANIYSFECSNYWKESNIKKSKIYNLPYIHKAVSDSDGVKLFSDGVNTNQSSDSWQYRGSFTPESHKNKNLVWGTKYNVPTISLNTFCKNHNIVPDFLHIDAEREEYNILKNLDLKYQPSIIWMEHSPKYNNGSAGELILFDTVDQMILNQGYIQCFYDGNDVLYVKKDCSFTKYKQYKHYSVHNVKITEHEKQIQSCIWLKRYQMCKDASWPELISPNEFFYLSDNIKHECRTRFLLTPDDRIL